MIKRETIYSTLIFPCVKSDLSVIDLNDTNSNHPSNFTILDLLFFVIILHRKDV